MSDVLLTEIKQVNDTIGINEINSLRLVELLMDFGFFTSQTKRKQTSIKQIN